MVSLLFLPMKAHVLVVYHFSFTTIVTTFLINMCAFIGVNAPDGEGDEMELAGPESLLQLVDPSQSKGSEKEETPVISSLVNENSNVDPAILKAMEPDNNGK